MTVSEAAKSAELSPFASSTPEGGVNASSSDREYVEIGVGGEFSLLLDREFTVSSERCLRWSTWSHFLSLVEVVV